MDKTEASTLQLKNFPTTAASLIFISMSCRQELLNAYQQMNMTKTMSLILSFGKHMTRHAMDRFFGKARLVLGGLAGTSNALPWGWLFSAKRSTFMWAGSTTCFLIMKTRLLNQKHAQENLLYVSGCMQNI